MPLKLATDRVGGWQGLEFVEATAVLPQEHR